MNNIYHIVDKDKNDIVFEFNTEQQQVWDECFVDEVMVVDPNILKARQLGMTTFFMLLYLDDVMWEENINAFIQSHDQKSIEKIFRTATYAYKKFKDLYPEIAPRIDRGGGSKYELFFPDNNSRISVGLELRSAAVHRLHLSETGFQTTDRIGATTSAVPAHLRYSSETTANGLNWFYDDWQEENVAYRKKFFFPWFMRDEYSLHDINTGPLTNEEKIYIKKVRASSGGFVLTKTQIEFRRMKISQLKSSSMFDQEFPYDDQVCFMRSSRSVFDVDNLKVALTKCDPVIEFIDDVKIMREYDRKLVYSCGVDTAEGVGGDNSTATIFDNKRRQCAVMKCGKTKPKEFAYKVEALCEIYGGKKGRWPLLGVERNNHGHAVLLELKDHIYYPSLYFYSDDEDRPGWLTDKVTRPLMLDALIDGVDHQTVKLNDPDTIKECLTFINNEGKMEAEEGKKDDLVICSAIAIQMVIENGEDDIYNNVSKSVLL